MKRRSWLLVGLFLGTGFLLSCGGGGGGGGGGSGPVVPPPGPLLAGATNFHDASYVHVNRLTGASTTLTGLGIAPDRFFQGMAFDTNANVLYAVDTDNHLLLTVNRKTGFCTPVGHLGFDFVACLAFDPNTDTLYAVDSATDQLITIDAVTGLGTAVGAVGFNYIGALAFDSGSNTLYGADVIGDALITINTSTGAGTSVANFVASEVHGLSFDAGTNTLFGIDRTSQNLVSINTTTAAFTTIGSLGSNSHFCLAWDDDNSELWSRRKSSSEFVQINATTGAVSAINTMSARTIQGLAYDANAQVFYGSDFTLQALIRIPGPGEPAELVGETSVVLDALAYDPNTDTLYGTDGGSLYAVSTADGQTTLKGPLGIGNVRGLAFDPATDRLYGFALGGDTLVTINTTSGVASTVGSSTLDVSVTGLGFDSSTNTLYGYDGNSAGLVAIDTSSGEATALGPAGSDTTWCLTYDSVEDEVVGINQATEHMVHFDRSTGIGRGYLTMGVSAIESMAYDAGRNRFYALTAFGELLDVDPDTGGCTWIADTAPNVSNCAGLAYDGGGDTLYAVNWVGDLFSIHPVTGASTNVGPTGFGGYGSLTFDSTTDTLYGAAFNQLKSIDPTTGVGTHLHAYSGSLLGLAFDPDSGMLIATTSTKQLLEIDPSSPPSPTVIGPTGPNTVGALAFRPGP